MAPGATLHLTATLTEYGLPMEHRGMVQAELTRPDGSKSFLGLAETAAGVHTTSVLATQSGIYTFIVRASGSTLRGRPFTREQIVTGAVWRGGDDPDPKTPDGGGDGGHGDLCCVLKCLFSDAVMTDRAVKRLYEFGIDVRALRRCLAGCCDERRPGTVTGPGLTGLAALDAGTLSVVRRVVEELMGEVG
jgi:hypothetical protein